MARDGTKTGGRQQGTLNRKTVEEIDRAGRVLDMIESNYLETDIEALTSHQRMMLYSDMMEYKAPKLSRIAHEGGDPDKPIHINAVDGLTFEQLYQLKYGRKPQ